MSSTKKGQGSPAATTKSAAVKNLSCLQGSYIRSAGSGQLLGRLLEVFQVLDTAEAPFPLEKSFVDALLAKDILHTSNADIQMVGASIIADVLRLGASNTTSTSIPFALSHCQDVVRLFCNALLRLRTSNKPSSAVLLHGRHCVERLAQSHSFQRLLPHCHNACDEELTSLFQTFLHELLVVDEDTAFFSRCAILLADCIAATHSVTMPQLESLLSAVSSAKKRTNLTGASIANAVLRRHEDLMAPLVATKVMHQFESGVEELKRVEITDGDISERRSALKLIAEALEQTVELVRVGIGMVSQLIPALQPSLLAEAYDMRVMTVRGFSKVFLVSTHVAGAFMPTYNLFLSRFTDPKALIRQELVKFAHASLLESPTEANWHNLTSYLESKLVDTDETVRRATITAVCDLAAARASSVPKQLVEAVGQRCADKHSKVRSQACERLMQLYNCIQYSWIPDAVFLSIHGEGGVVGIELGLEDMLPPSTKVADASESERKTKKAKSKENAMFDFEMEDGTGTGGSTNQDDVSDEALKAAAKKATFVDGFCKLCGDLSQANFSLLLTLMEKKHQLRQTVERLFELRADVKKIGNIESPEGQKVKVAIHRLLTFLQTITHAKKGEWDSIFRAKDETVPKAFLAACDSTLIDHQKGSNELIKKVQGRLQGEVLEFVQGQLIRRLFFPVSPAHVAELAARIATERTTSFEKRIGSVRAAACVVAAAPQLFSTLFPALVDTLSLEAGRDMHSFVAAAQSKSSPVKGGKLAVKHAAEQASEKLRLEVTAQRDLLLLVLQTLARCTPDAKNEAMIQEQSKSLITSIGRNCLQTPFPAIAKASATALLQLFPNHAKAAQQLLQAAREKLAPVGRGESPLIPQVASWIKTIAVLVTLPEKPVGKGEEILQDISPVLFAAVRTAIPEEDNVEAKSSKKGEEWTANPACSTSALIVDACCKCMSRIAMTQTAAKSLVLVPMVVDDFVAAFRETRQLNTGSVGAVRKRMAIAKQVIKLVARPVNFLELEKELMTAVMVSAEDNPQARHVLQRKIQHHMSKQKCDVRIFALLIMTAMGEDTRAGYQQLRTIVQHANDKLRQIRVSESVSLSDPKALQCYLEYCIPTLILFLAHHTFFNMERESNFLGYQRVFHLLFDELLRESTNCASFCSEMLRKLKQHDDALDPDSSATRMICDLASKVMIECLGQKSVRADSLKPYPGAVLLPRMFVKPANLSRFPPDTIYLDSSVTVGPNPPFRAVFGGGQTPGRSAGATSTSQPPAATEDEEIAAASSAVAEKEDEEPAPSKRLLQTPPPRVPSSSPDKKRGREAASEPVDDEDEEEEAQLRDEATIRETLAEAVKSLNRAEFEKMSWKKIKQRVEVALDKKLTESLVQYVKMELQKLVPPA